MADKTLIKQSLQEASNELNVALTPSGKVLTLVDFCESYLKLPPKELVEFCSEELINEVPIITVSEATFADYGEKLETGVKNIWQKIRGGGNTQKSAEGSHNVFQKMGDALNTKGSALRNAPMLQVINPTTQVARYYAFPALSLNRPGHKQVLDKIIQKEQGEGNIVNQIPINHEARVAALKAGNYAVISMPPTEANKKQAIEIALKKLDTIVQQANNFVSTNLFISDEEANQLKQSVQQAVTGVSTAVSQMAATDEVATMAAQVDADQKTVPSQPTATVSATGTSGEVRNQPRPSATVTAPSVAPKAAVSGAVASPTPGTANLQAPGTFTYNPVSPAIVGEPVSPV